jgi:predicted ATP-grasp superfamily ATP-dependent carboligase
MNSKDQLHILVMTASWQSALAAMQSYGRKGHSVSVTPGRGTTTHPNFSSVHVQNIVAFNNDGSAERAYDLARLVDEQGIDLVVPVSDRDALVVAHARQLFPEKGVFFSSSVDSILVTRSRNRTTELCRSIGIATPETEFVTHATAAIAAGQIGYPCFLKLSGTVASTGVFAISTESDLKQRLALVPMGTEMQLQARVEGDLVDITGFAAGGRVTRSFAFSCDYEHSHGGTPAYARRVFDGRLDAILSRIVHELNWTGGIDLDLLQDKDGDYFLLEINPRFSGTIVFPLKVGIDLPMGYVNLKYQVEDVSRDDCVNTDAEHFISLYEEALYVRAGGEERRKRSIAFRSDNRWVDNSFTDDVGYSAALLEQIRTALLHKTSGG